MRLDEACKEAEHREAILKKIIANQSAQLREADEKVTTAISSFQDIATTQIAAVTKELTEMQARSSMFLQKFEEAETERSRHNNELRGHQMDTILEREAEHKKHMQDLEDARAKFSHDVDKITAETKARVRSLNTTYKVITTNYG